jgi:hypothetical protein
MMDAVPLYRRPGFVATIGLGMAALLYFRVLRSTSEAATPPTFLSYLTLLLGLLAVVGLIIFIAYLLIWVRDAKQLMSAFFRLLILMLWAGTNILSLFNLASPTLRTVVTHLDVGLLSLLLVLALTAQFVLPVRETKDRLAVIRRLLGFLVGERGPMTFIRNGKAREAHEERLRRSPGVFLVDYSSAAVLRTDTQFTRAVGPGVHFTNRGEWRAESLDLRRQVRTTKGFELPAGEPIEMEGVNSLALTRDGIPISTDLTVTFMLDTGHTHEPREGRLASKPPYEYNPQAVERAVYGHAYGEVEELPWTELPLRLAVDLWREIVKEKTLDELINADKTTPSPLQEIKDQIQSRLTPNKSITQNENVEQPAGEERESNMLRSRGIRVLGIEGIDSIYLPDDVRAERMIRWREDWAGSIQEELEKAKDTVKQARQQGEAKSNETLLRELTTDLRQQLKEGKTPGKRDTLRLILGNAIRLCSQQGAVADGANLVIQLTEIHDELSTFDENCRDAGSRGVQ